MVSKLQLNGLLPDEATDRQGNCGLDAFARSLMSQMRNGGAAVGASESARNRRNMKNSDDGLALLRRVGLSWWGVVFQK